MKSYKQLKSESTEEYTRNLERMLDYTFQQIANSKSPDENLKWFVSEEARKWYELYKYGKQKKEKIQEDNWVEEVFNRN